MSVRVDPTTLPRPAVWAAQAGVGLGNAGDAGRESCALALAEALEVLIEDPQVIERAADFLREDAPYDDSELAQLRRDAAGLLRAAFGATEETGS